jgi:aldose 1-epimerase
LCSSISSIQYPETDQSYLQASAKINSLNNKSYTLTANNGPNALHGGVKGWGKRIWDGPTPIGLHIIPGLPSLQGGESVSFKLRSNDGEEGYPGTVGVTVVYTSGTQVENGKDVMVLGIEYEVAIVGEEEGVEETVINVTNHSYFNLAGTPTIEGTEITLSTNNYLPVDETGIPTSGPTAYTGITAAKPFTLGASEPDVDDCFIVSPPSTNIPLDTRTSPLTKLVAAYHPSTKIHLEVLSTEPAFQFYTGKYIDVPEVEGKAARGPRSGFCVEPSRYVNAVNVPEWRGQVVLRRGEVYGSRIVYRGWSDE